MTTPVTRMQNTQSTSSQGVKTDIHNEDWTIPKNTTKPKSPSPSPSYHDYDWTAPGNKGTYGQRTGGSDSGSSGVSFPPEYWKEGLDWRDYYKDEQHFLRDNPDYIFSGMGEPIKLAEKDTVIEGINVPADQLPADYQKQLNALNAQYGNPQAFIQSIGVRNDSDYQYQIQKHMKGLKTAYENHYINGDYYNAALAKRRLVLMQKQFPQFARNIYNRVYDKAFGSAADNMLVGMTGMNSTQLEQDKSIGLTDKEIRAANIKSGIAQVGVGVAGALSAFAAPGILGTAMLAGELYNGKRMYNYRQELDKARLNNDADKAAYYEHQLRSASGLSAFSNAFNTGFGVAGLGRLFIPGAGAAPTFMDKVWGTVTAPISNKQIAGLNVGKWVAKGAPIAAGIGAEAALQILGAPEGFNNLDWFKMKLTGHGEDYNNLQNAIKASARSEQFNAAMNHALMTGDSSYINEFYEDQNKRYDKHYKLMYEKYKGNIPQEKVNDLVSEVFFKSGHVSPGFYQTTVWKNADPEQQLKWITQLGTTRAIARFNIGSFDGTPTVAAAKGIQEKAKNKAAFINEAWEKDNIFRSEVGNAIKSLPFNSLLKLKNSAKKSEDADIGMQLFTKAIASDSNYAADIVSKGVDYLVANPEALQNLASSTDNNDTINKIITAIENGPEGIEGFIDKMEDPAGMLNKANMLMIAMERKGIAPTGKMAELKDKSKELANYVFNKDPLKAAPIFTSIFLRRQGMDTAADIAQNPAAFYLTAATLALGTANSLIPSDNNEEQGTEDSDLDYDEVAYRQRLKRRSSNSRFNNLL